MTSPLGIVAAGVGAAVGIVALGPLGAIPGAVLGWVGRVGAAVPRNPARPEVAPRELQQPWRTYVERAQASDRRFATAVERSRPGPLRDRLGEIGERVQAGLAESWEVAQRGQALTEARREVDVAAIAAELADTRARLAATSGPGTANHDGATYAATVEALEAQLGAAQRMESLISRADAQLRLLDARMSEAVTRAIELSAPAGDVGDLGSLGDDVDSVVSEMEILRQALDEARGGPSFPVVPLDASGEGRPGRSGGER
jgi:hypothetical protein